MAHDIRNYLKEGNQVNLIECNTPDCLRDHFHLNTTTVQRCKNENCDEKHFHVELAE